MKFIGAIWLCLALLSPFCPAGASQEKCLRTCRQVNEFMEHGSGRANFVLSAQVVNDPTDTTIFVQDETGRIIISNQKQTSALRKGDVLKVHGFVSVNTNGEIWTQPESVMVFGRAEVPPPTDITLSDLNRPENAYLHVRVSGTVFSVTADEFDPGCVIVMLCDGKAITPVIISRKAYELSDVRTDATIRLTGYYWRAFSGIRKYTGPGIVLDDACPIEVLAPPPDDPFAAPELERRFYRTPEEIALMGPRTVKGRVIATWGGDRVMVKTADNRIVNITMLEGTAAPRLGESGVFVGYPYTDIIRINLMRARFRQADMPAAPEDVPEDVTADKLIAGNLLTSNGVRIVTCHGKLFRIRGVVKSLPMEHSHEQRLMIDCGGHQVPVDISSCRDVVHKVEAGSEIETVGRCLLETESWRTDNVFPHVRGFVIVARTADDIRVTRPPPWWTMGRLMMLIGIFFVGLVGSLIWVFALHRVAERRGEALYRSQRAQITERHTREIAEMRIQDRTRLAIELHDTISQNLTGAALQLGTATQFVTSDSALAIRHISIATRALDSCREELRNCIWDLRSNTLDEKDLNEAIRMTVQRLVGEAKLQIRFNIPREKLSDNTVHALMQIVRELATNAVRHGHATLIRIAGALQDGMILCSVADDGCGFDPDDHPGLAEGHFGLQGIEERVDELGGGISIDSKAGTGARIAFSIRAK